ncbi:hypothetical protein B0H19DRAFT_1084896 [Mycena capillaripes]|nr:hypothetical protein B0H19DRAFT_1084896 [Mycena capillaripes]
MPLAICTPSASVKQTLAPDTAIPSTSDISLVSNTQATLATMGWQQWLPGAKETHLKKAAKAHHQTAAETVEKKERELEGKREREHILAAERQRRFRARRKSEKEEEDEGKLADNDNASVVLMRRADAAATAQGRQTDVAEISRTGTQDWRQGRNGTKGGAVQKKATTTRHHRKYPEIDSLLQIT